MKKYRRKSNRLAELAYKIKRADELYNINQLSDIDGVLEEYKTISQGLILDLVDLAKIQKDKITKANLIMKIRKIGQMVDLMTDQIDKSNALRGYESLRK